MSDLEERNKEAMKQYETSLAHSKGLMDMLLKTLLDDRYFCDLDWPGFRIVKAKLIEIDFKNITYKPIKVSILEKLYREHEVDCDTGCFGSTGTKMEKRRWHEQWVSLQDISNFRSKE